MRAQPAAFTCVITLLVLGAAGCAREGGTGAIKVIGDGTGSFYVADSSGERDLTGHRSTGTTIDMPAGDYVVRLNGSRAPVRVEAGRLSELVAGSLVVSGGGAEAFYLSDAAGEGDLTGHRAAGTPLELLPGSYQVRIGSVAIPLQIRPGERTTVTPGS